MERKGELIHTFAIAPIVAYEWDGDLDPIYEYIKTLEYDQEVKGNCKSVDRWICKRPELRELVSWFDECIADYTLNVCDSKQKIDIMNSWVNVYKPDQDLPAHFHSNSFLSGTFYIASDQEGGAPLRIHSQLKNFIYSFEDQITEATPEFNPYLDSTRDLASIPGNLLLFSSQLVHSVPPNQSEYNRVSLSFNTFPRMPFGGDLILNKITG